VSSEENEPKEMQTIDPTPEVSETEEDIIQKPEYTIGRYIIGLSGDLENEAVNEEDQSQATSGQEPEQFENLNNRTLLRTLIVETSKPMPKEAGGDKGTAYIAYPDSQPLTTIRF
jgi:hypothetical protein